MPAGTHLAGVFIFLFISLCFSNNKNDEKYMPNRILHNKNGIFRNGNLPQHRVIKK